MDYTNFYCLDHKAFKESVSQDDKLKDLTLISNEKLSSGIHIYFEPCDSKKPNCDDISDETYQIKQLVFHPSFGVQDTGAKAI